MPRLEPISTIHYGNRRWRYPSGYRFASADTLAPLILQEMTRAVMSLPIALVQARGEVPAYRPAAILGLTPGRNLLVDSTGRWLGDYVPAAYRGHPFALAATTDGQRLVCVDMDSGLISDEEGEPFFTAEGKPTPAIEKIIDFLTQVTADQAVTTHACARLDQYRLIQPWPIQIRTESGQQQVTGAYRIDEPALSRLPAETLKELQACGALMLAYCQLLSMQHLGRLGQLAQAHAQLDAHQAQLDLGLRGDDNTLRFDFSTLDNPLAT